MRSKVNNRIYYLGLLILIGAYILLRVVGFEEKMTYQMDQGIHLMESYEMVLEKKPRLIGPMVTSRVVNGKGFFIGPYYYYALAASGLITRWNPVAISVLWLVAEGAVVLIFVGWVKGKFGNLISWAILYMVATSHFFIVHSRFFWNPHFLLPLGLLGIILLDKFTTKKRRLYLYCFFWLWGLAFSFHYMAVFWALPLVYYWWKSKSPVKLTDLLMMVTMFVGGDLLFFVFEVRHDFYNLTTAWQSLVNNVGGGQELHYFIYPLVGPILVAVAAIFSKLNKKRFGWVAILGLGVLAGIGQKKYINLEVPYRHPAGWSYPLITRTVEEILKEGCQESFNVASTISGDTRAYDLRFLLTKNGCRPMGVEDYPLAEKLFLISPQNRNPMTEKIWEVRSMGNIEIEKQTDIGNMTLFQLKKVIN